MAGLVVVRDADPARRQRAVEAATRRLRDAGLPQVSTLERDDVAAVWGTYAGAPVDRAAGEGWDAVLLGDAFDEGHDRRVTAAELGRRWRDGGPGAFDGHHVALVVADGRVVVGTDLLGLHPVHHTVVGDVTLVATGTGLLRSHESFRPRLDPLGLATVLLADAPMGGRTVLSGVRRLAPGHAVVLGPEGRPEERPTYAVPVTTEHHGIPLGAAAALVHEELAGASRRHAAGPGRLGLMLSGGLDSRLLAGLFLRLAIPVAAVTFGLETDTEWRFAHRVAERVGVAHERLPDDGSADNFERWLRWDALSATPFLESLDVGARFDRVASGYTMDATVGGSHIDWCHDPATGAVGFTPFLARVNHAGVAIGDLRRLLRPERFGDAVDGAIEAVRADWDAGGDDDLARAWAFDLAHRQRFWVGARVPRQSFGAWPVLPHTDRRVLAAAGGLPLALLGDRQVEAQLCRASYPDLARIPLDRATHETAALVPRTPDLLREAVGRRVRATRERLGRPGRETRYFTRIFDIRGDNWAEVRRRVEPARAAAHELFVPEVLAELVPPAAAPWDRPSAYYDSNGAKMLLGVLAMLDDGITA
jgi:asparagine synthase (glutamine-hydrolysing)